MIAALMFGLALSTGVAGVVIAQADQPVSVTRIAGPEKALRFEVIVPGSLDAVWTAFTTPEGLGTWLWRDVRVELRNGGDWLVLYPGGKTGGGPFSRSLPDARSRSRRWRPSNFREFANSVRPPCSDSRR